MFDSSMTFLKVFGFEDMKRLKWFLIGLSIGLSFSAWLYWLIQVIMK